MKNLFVTFVTLVAISVVAHAALTVPEEIHLSLTGNPSEMVVMWMTTEEANTTVKYWPSTAPGSVSVSTGSSDHYYFLPDYTSPAIHTVKMTGLQPDTIYNYQVGSDALWSNIRWFHTEPLLSSSSGADSETPLVTFAALGDFGTSNNSLMVLDALLDWEHNNRHLDLLIHAGDISYANGVQPRWDEWGRIVEPFSAQVPWMVAVGNHEIADLFLAYLYRFRMPAVESGSSEGNLYYSFNYYNIHFIAVDSEQLEYWHLDSQYKWLENDLKNVDRRQQPWIVAFWHTPWYCSNTVHLDSGKTMKDQYEELFYKYKVNLVVNGHVHAYERTYPVYQEQLVDDAPVYITCGVGGTQEGTYNNWVSPSPVWSAHREAFWAFGVVSVFNSTHMNWQLVRANDSNIDDMVWITRSD